MKESRFVNILIFISVFVSSITFFREPFEGYLHYVIFLMLLPFFVLRFGFPGKPMRLLILPLIVGIVEIFVGNNTFPLFLKIFIGVLLSSTFYYYVMLFYELDTEKIFRYYLRGAVIVALIGVFQLVSYYIRFTPGYNFSWIFNKWGFVPSSFGLRINSIFSEASQCAIVLSPACFVAMRNLFFRGGNYGLTRNESILVLVVMVLTTSSTGYIGLFLILLFLMLNYGQFVYFILGSVFIMLGATLLYNYIPEFQKRVDTSIGLWVNEDFSVRNVNSSSFILYNNYHIAVKNFEDNFLTGSGLGSHPVAFDRYSLTRDQGILNIQFNKADGNSMLLRLLSETGLMGIGFMLWLLISRYVRRNRFDEESPYWMISNATLIIILLYLLRQGNYFLNGFPMFLWLYYYAKENYLERLENPVEEIEEEEEEEYEEEEFLPAR